MNPSNQYATIVESRAVTDLVADQPYQGTFNLAQFFRATTLAKNFQYYRAKKVKWEYMPLYNTFQENNAVSAVAKPQLYFMMNRDQDPYWATRPPGQALFLLQSAGADPVPFTNNKEIIYKPNWCSPGLTAYTSAEDPPIVTSIVQLGMKKQFGWLPTPNQDAWNAPNVPNLVSNPVGAYGYSTSPVLNGGVLYNGHNFYIQQDNEPGVPVAKLLITVEWEFKLGKNNYANFTDPAPADTTTNTQTEPVK